LPVVLCYLVVDDVRDVRDDGGGCVLTQSQIVTSGMVYDSIKSGHNHQAIHIQRSKAN